MIEASVSQANQAAKTSARGKPWPPRLRQYLQVVAAIAAKDLRSEARGRNILAVWATFGLLLLVVFYLTLNISPIAFQTVAPGVLWVIFALISTMGLGRGFNQEHELGGWQALVLVGFSLLYHWPVDTVGMLIVLVLGTLGLLGVGTFVAAYVADKGGKELLLPLMVLPVVIPVIALAGQMTSMVLSQPLSSDWVIVLVFLMGYDAITVLGGAVAFAWIAEFHPLSVLQNIKLRYDTG